MITTRKIAIALGLAGALALGASTTYAAGPDAGKCQKDILKAASKFQATATLNLSLCANKVAAENAKKVAGKPTDMSKVADFCEKMLAKTYDVAHASGNKDAVSKLRASIDAAVAKPDCDLATMTKNGLLLSGGQGAPGATLQKFTADYLLVKGESEAIRAVQAAVPSLLDLIQSAQNPPAGKGVNPDCHGAVNDPNLCAFKVECKTHTCTLGGSSGALLTTEGFGGITLPLALTGANALDFCTITGALAPDGLEPGVRYLAGDPSATIAPVDLGGGTFVCIDTLRGSGFCDCSGGGAGLKNTSICQDRIVSNNTGTDDCGSSVLDATADPNFPPSQNGFPKNTPSGATTTGDCMDMLTTQFTVLLVSDYGTDGIPCTGDETVAPNPPAGVPLTTGTAVATLKDAVSAPGFCSDAATQCIDVCTNVCVSGTCTLDAAVCTSNADCDTSCAGTISAGNVSTTPITGAKGTPVGMTACQGYAQGNLHGLKMVGAFPGPGKAPIGDSVTSFTMECN